MSISKEWKRKIAAAQQVKTADVGGERFPRIGCGADGFGEPHGCGDCAAMPGQLHVEGCTVERCPRCKTGQRYGCACFTLH